MNKSPNTFFTKLSLVIVLCLFSFSLSAQLDKKHYIPPFFAPNRTSGNVKDHWIVLSTQESEEFKVTIKRGNDDFREITISKESPQMIHLGSGFSTNNNPTGIVNESGRNRVLEKEGFMLEAENPFFTAIYQRSSAQGDVLTCKGETALGNEFYSGHIYGDFGKVESRAQFLTVMATFDNTEVTFSNPRVKWDGQASNTFTITLNKNESYALGATYQFAQDNNYGINDYNGTKVTSTKPIAVNSGSWMGSGNLGNQQDIGLDQLVPQHFVGKKYIAVKGYGTEIGEKVIVVATRPNTQLFVNDTLEHTMAQSGDYYIINRDEYNDTTNNVAIEASENIYVYQTLSGKHSDVAVGMCFIPPLSCLSNREVNISYANSIGSPLLNIIAEVNSDVKINGISIMQTPQPVIGNPDWITYRIDAESIKAYNDPPTSFEITSDKSINAALGFSEGAIGGAGFYSGFGVSPQLQATPTMEGTVACYPANAILQASGYDSYIWYYNNEIMPGDTASTIFPTQTGQYRVSGTTGCGTTKASDPFILKTCLSMEGGGTYDEHAGDLKVLIRLGLPSDQDIEYWYRTVPINTIEGEDYQAKTGVGTMLAGNTLDSLFIEITDDELYEKDDESFKFEIYYSDHATIQNPEITFNIVDNDTMPELTIPTYATVEENAGQATISIVKVGQTQDSVLVSYSTDDTGTSSTEGVHYTGTSGILVFAPHQYIQEISVPIIDNEILSTTKQFNIKYSNTQGANLNGNQTNVTIYDNDVPSICLTLTSPNNSVVEGDSILLNIDMDQAQEVDVKCLLSFAHLTTNAADFGTIPSDTITIAIGETHTEFWIQTIPDSDPENDEVCNVELVNVINARSCSGQLRMTIENDDYIPELTNDNYSCEEDKSVSGSVLDNDVISGDLPVTTTFFAPSHGTFTDNGEGKFDFTPDPNFYGAVNFSYAVVDQSGDSVVADVLIMVSPINDVPTAINDTIEIDEDTPITIFPLLNDLDVDRTGLSLESVADNRLGDAVIQDDHIEYTPHRNVYGTDELQYSIIDTEGDPSVAKIIIIINPINDAPIANDDNYRIDEDDPTTTFDVLLNDDDQDRSGITITRLSNVTGGNAVIVDNKIAYTLHHNYWGQANITYTITDGEGDTARANVNIEVLGANDFPTAYDDFLFTDEDVLLTLSLLDNDVDDDQRGLTIDSITPPISGQIINNNGTFSYLPNLDYCGVDSFRYFVQDWNFDADFAWAKVTINCVNEAPRAMVDSFILNEDDPTTLLDIMQNDEDPDKSGIIVHEVFGATGGTAILNNNKVEYTLTPNFFGNAGFTYVLRDGENDLDSVQAHITVLGANDTPIANNDSITTKEDSTITFSPMANDIDIDLQGILLDSITTPHHGELSANQGLVTYVPHANFCGMDSFLYFIADAEEDKAYAWTYLWVNCVNDAPVAHVDSFIIQEDAPTLVWDVLQNDEDPDQSGLTITEVFDTINGTVQIIANSITYTTTPNFFGNTTFSYVVSDGENDKDTTTVHVQVMPVNDYPVANNDSVNLDEDSFTTIPLLDNDVDVDLSGLSIDTLYAPLHGELDYTNNILTYTPAPDYFGTDSFQYFIQDGEQDKDFAWVHITVNGVNDTPTATQDSVWASEEKATAFYPLVNDLDPDLSGLSIINMSTPENGTITLVNNEHVYTPDNNYNGLDSVSYTISDGENDQSSAKIIFTVTEVNDYPVATNDTITVTEDIALSFDPLANDTDVEDSLPSTFVIHQEPTLGTYDIIDGQIMYTPLPNIWGADTMTYVAKDSLKASSNIATIYITIDSVNEAPILLNLDRNLDEDTQDSSDVVILAFDPDFSGLTLTKADDGTHGKASILVDQLIYAPDSNYFGADTVMYYITDGEGDTTAAWVAYTVLPINDVPVAYDDSVFVDEDALLVFNPLANDKDVEEAVLTDYTIITTPTMGNYSVENGDIHYQAFANEWGYDTMSYVVRDSNLSVSNLAHIYITIDSVNEAPILTNLNSTLDEDHQDTSEVIVFAQDIDFSGLTLVEASGAKHGDASILGTQVVYSPHLNYFGKDTLTYKVMDGENDTSAALLTYNILPVNDFPTANDVYESTFEDITLDLLPATNDTDIEDDSLINIVIFKAPTMGTYVLDGAKLSYTPNRNLWGNDTIIYFVKDSEEAPSNMANIYITVDSVNEAPILSDIHINTNEDTEDTIAVMPYALSPDFSELTLLSVTNGMHGASRLYGNEIIYTPELNYYGKDTISYTIKDGEDDETTAQITLDVISVNDAPVAVNDTFVNVVGGERLDSTDITLTVINNDYDIDEDIMQGAVLLDTLPIHGTVVLGDNNLSFTYTPDSAFVGYDSLSYHVLDTLNARSNQAWVSIFTDSFNYVPRAINDSLTVAEDDTIIFNPIVNDWDIHGDSLWPTVNNIIAGPTFNTLATANGIIELHNDSVWKYLPKLNYVGKDSAYYQANDLKGGVTTAKIIIDVTPVNDRPMISAQNDAIVYVENSGNQTVVQNFGITDIENDTLQKFEIIVTGEDMTTCDISVSENARMTQQKDSTATEQKLTLASTKLTYADWKNIINGFRFRNDSDNDTLMRQVDIVAWDSPTDHSDTLSFTIAMQSVNDAPINMVRPQLSGIALPDSIISCDTGQWFDPDGDMEYCFQWNYMDKGVVKDILNTCYWSLNIPDSVENADAIWCNVVATDNGFPLPTKYTLATSDTIFPPNYRPSAIALNNNTIARSMTAGSFVGLLSTTDRDQGQSYTYELLSGIDTFLIDGDSLLLAIDGFYIDTTDVQVNIRVTDNGMANLSMDAVFEITLVNDLMPVMDLGYPQLLDVTGDSVAVSIRSNKPGIVSFIVVEREGSFPSYDEWVNAQQLMMEANQEVTLSATGLESESHYSMLIQMTDTSGHHASESASLAFRTDDITGPTMQASTPYVVRSSVDSAVIAVRLSEKGKLYYSLKADDTMLLNDTTNSFIHRADTALVCTDSLGMDDPTQVYHFTVDSLWSQTNYQLTFYSKDSINNYSEVSNFTFSTRDTVTPLFANTYPMMNPVDDYRMNYAVSFNEGGTMKARICDHKDKVTDFNTPDELGIYDAEWEVMEGKVMNINTPKLAFNGIYRLDIMMEDTAGNHTEIRSVNFRYPEPYNVALSSEIFYLNEDITFKTLDGDASYTIYDLSGAPVQIGTVRKNTPSIDINGLYEGIYVIHIATQWELKSYRIAKVGAVREDE